MQILKIWKFLFGTVCVYLEFLSVLYLTLNREDVFSRLLWGEDSEVKAGGTISQHQTTSFKHKYSSVGDDVPPEYYEAILA